VLGVSSAGVIVDEVLSGLDSTLLVVCALAAVALVVGLMAAIFSSRSRLNVPDDVAAPAA
jgi:flagellar biosynthesis protein FliQ